MASSSLYTWLLKVTIYLSVLVASHSNAKVEVGDDGLTEFNWRASKTPLSGTELQTVKEIEKGFRIYFPSRETVIRSKGGVSVSSQISHSTSSPVAKWIR
jgi:hypothetical protein